MVASSLALAAIPAYIMVMHRESKNRSLTRLLLQIWQSVAFLCFSQSLRVIKSGFLFAIIALSISSSHKIHCKNTKTASSPARAS